MYDAISSHDNYTFWKRFSSLHDRNINVNRIDGCVDSYEVANCFKDTYSKVYESSDSISADKLNRRFHEAFSAYSRLHQNDPLTSHFFS